MKQTLLALSLLAAFAANAQTTVDSTSGSASQAGAQSGSSLAATNSGNVSATAVGNQAQSGSDSRSQSGAISGSQSGAQGNSVIVDQRGPTSQTVTSTSTSRAENILNGHTVEDVNVRNSGTTTQNVVSSGTVTTNENVHYSGSQTVKNVPSIAMSGPASGPCTGASGGLGLAGPGWGVGLNGSTVMVDCRLRENTRVLGMAMQSFDGAANPQEKGEVTVMFMDSLRALAGYNDKLVNDEKIPMRGRQPK